jgi:hypothetical protein
MLLDPDPHSQYGPNECGSGSTPLVNTELSGPTFYSIVPLLEMDEGVVLDLLDPVHFPEGLEALPAHSNASVLHPKITRRITGRPPHELSVNLFFLLTFGKKLPAYETLFDIFIL